jgi:hypothetical protein
MPAPTVPQHVTLSYRGVRSDTDLLALLGEERVVNVISAPLDLARGGPPADVVVVDVPAEDRPAVCQELRYYYRGPLVVLLHPGDNSHDLPPDRSRTLLTRPFSMRELAAALATSAPPRRAQPVRNAARSHKPPPGWCEACGPPPVPAAARQPSAGAGPMCPPAAQPGPPRPRHGRTGSQTRPRRRIRPAPSPALRPPPSRQPRDRGRPPPRRQPRPPRPRPPRQRALGVGDPPLRGASAGRLAPG